jgi:secreted trypsin-like serine protease
VSTRPSLALRPRVAARAAVLAAIGAAALAPAPADAVFYGRAIGPGDVPGMGQLLTGDRFTCGASLVTDTLVLTAAHCVSERYESSARNPFEVVFGRADAEGHDGEEVDVVGVAVHPDYGREAPGDSDVALLRLVRRPVGVPRLALASPADEPLLRGGRSARVAGWGQTEASVRSAGGEAGGAFRGSETLREARLNILSRRGCRKAMRAHGRTPSARLALVDCVGGPAPHPAPCFGDSGGPLLVEGPAGPLAAGVLSSGTSGRCGRGADLYTRLWRGRLHDWVRRAIEDDRLPPEPRSRARRR